LRRKSPLNASITKWYLTQETAGSVDLQEIEGRSALSLGDVQSVLTATLWKLCPFSRNAIPNQSVEYFDLTQYVFAR
jgi:hypothetical protein